MDDNIVIFGNGPVAFVAYHTFKHDNNLTISGFTVDRAFIRSDTYLGLPLIPFDEVEKKFSPAKYKMVIALGFLNTNKLRAKKYEEVIQKGYLLPTIINPKALTYPDLIIGNNCIIGANVVIHPGVSIGNNVIIRDNSFIGHNVTIEDHCFVGAGAVISGGSYVEEYCLLGVNSTIRDSIKVAKSCIIGAGVTVLKNTNEREVFISNSGQKYPFSSDDI